MKEKHKSICMLEIFKTIGGGYGCCEVDNERHSFAYGKSIKEVLIKKSNQFEKQTQEKKKPTIAELEKILDEKGEGSIQLNPDGSISVKDKPTFCTCKEPSRIIYMGHKPPYCADCQLLWKPPKQRIEKLPPPARKAEDTDLVWIYKVCAIMEKNIDKLFDWINKEDRC